MEETNGLGSAAAVNAEQRKIARDMDDQKQQEEMSVDTPKQHEIAGMIESAQRQQQAHPPISLSSGMREGIAADDVEREQEEAAQQTRPDEYPSPIGS